ncbi:MAG: hypothetical protein AAGN35_20090 [Bacteroidota bacterium]
MKKNMHQQISQTNFKQPLCGGLKLILPFCYGTFFRPSSAIFSSIFGASWRSSELGLHTPK